MSLALRLLIAISIPVSIWGALYLAVRLGLIPPSRFTPWLRGAIFITLPAMIASEAARLNHIADIAGIFFFTFLAADFWLQRYSKISSIQIDSQTKS
jgi:hypothetical protein